MTRPRGPRCAPRRSWRTGLRVGCWLSAIAAGCFDFEPHYCQGDCCQGQCEQVQQNAPSSDGAADMDAGAFAAGAGAAGRTGAAEAAAGASDTGASHSDAGETGASGQGAPASDAGETAAPDAAVASGEPQPSDPCGEELANKPAQICLGAQCLELDCSQRAALSLWLDPSALPPAGQELQSWPDRSGLGNDARRQLDDPLYPLLVQDEARTVTDAALRRSVVLTGNWLSLPQPPGNPSLRFGSEEFLVLVAASVPGNQRSDTYLYSASDALGELRLLLQPDCGGVLLGDRPGAPNAPFYLTGSSVGLYDDQTRLYGLHRRSPNEIEVRLNGSSDRAIDCLDPTLDVDAEDNAFSAVGTTGILRAPSASRGRISAVVAFKGHLADAQVTAIEQFLCSALGACAPVAAATVPPADPACAPDAPGLTSCIDEE